jgi:FkbM family methyltransferase
MTPKVNIIRAKHGNFLAFFEPRGISGVLTASGVWDEVTLSIAAKLIDSDPERPMVYDIGANMGTFTVPIARHIAPRSGKVFAFEPQRIVYYQLCGNLFLNRLDNVYAEKIALSDESGVRPIFPLDYAKAWNIGGYTLDSESDGQLRISDSEPCEFQPLDNLAPPRQATLIKVDVEGMENIVFRGASEFLLRNAFPPIIFESWSGDPKAEEAITTLTKYGYDITRYAEHDCLAQHQSRPAII